MSKILKGFLVKIHFSALALAILNGVFHMLFAYSLITSLLFSIKLIAIISGILLFILYRRPFKTATAYFSIYMIGSLIVLIAFSFRNLLFGLIAAIFLYPVMPDQHVYTQESIAIYIPHQGFISRCCSYQVSEQKYLIFEQDYGIWKAEGDIDFQTLSIKNSSQSIEITYRHTSEQGVWKQQVIKK